MRKNVNGASVHNVLCRKNATKVKHLKMKILTIVLCRRVFLYILRELRMMTMVN